ncbi:hypothetical protein, partial [Streptomyces broussonetiae]|uniref:hypothetical protein n=1 Tax=Streptomyces broussonetiae TaxID=2686304 RepID=UPI0035D745D0
SYWAVLEVLAACGGHGPGSGYVAVGAAGGPESNGAAATPTGSVSLVPLDGNSATGAPGSPRPSSSGSAAPGSPGQSTPAPGTPGASGSTGGAASGSPGEASGGTGGASGRTTPGPPATGSPTPTPAPGTTVGPAVLTWGRPTTAATDQRWCQKVTVAFHNSGGTAVRSGSVTFSTHIIGALGIDWGTVDSAADLPAPIAPGARPKPTWTVCVDAWRVPLGMHVETRDVSVQWK